MFNLMHLRRLENEALYTMRSVYKPNWFVLIAVVPKGPLTSDNRPNKEFKARLDKAVELYKRLKEEGNRPVVIVTGSRENVHGYTLSAAGVHYLYNSGVDEVNTFGESYNYFYDKNGVGNYEQHVNLISKLFFTYNYSELYTVCNASQVLTLSLLFMQHKIMSKFSVTDTDMVNHVKELQTLNRLFGGKTNYGKCKTTINRNALKWPRVASTVLNRSLCCGDEYVPSFYTKQPKLEQQ